LSTHTTKTNTKTRNAYENKLLKVKSNLKILLNIKFNIFLTTITFNPLPITPILTSIQIITILIQALKFLNLTRQHI